MLGVGAEGPTAAHLDDEAAGPGRATAQDDERDAWAVLAAVEGLGPVGFAGLLGRFGTGRRILEVAAEPGGTDRLAAASAEPGPDGEPSRRAISLTVAETIAEAANGADRTLQRIRQLGLRVVTLEDGDYPARLAAIELPPHVLFVRGATTAMASEHAVAVVGTRRATTPGRGLAARIARALVGSGATVVSGLAVGIDGAAHAATIDAGGRTVAVIGGGHAELYPRAHAGLAKAIIDGGGAVVSELGPDVGPSAWSFPRRNRLISGLADATVVVEAPARSGALLTASWALEQGRDCFLVPGPVEDPSVAGCLAFLREFPGGARIVAGIPQLIEDLGLAVPPSAAGAPPLAAATLAELGTSAGQVARELLAGHVTVEELMATTGLPVAAVLATLTLLERRGLAVGVFGRYRPAGTLATMDPPPVRGRRRRVRDGR